MACSAILCRGNPGPLFFRHDGIGLCPGLHLIDLFLLLVQLLTRNPLINPLMLICLPLIQQSCVDLGKATPVISNVITLTPKIILFLDTE